MAEAVNAAPSAPEALRVNAMPAPTWGWLKINDTTVEVPEGLLAAGPIFDAWTAGIDIYSAPDGTFEAELEEAGQRYPSRRASAPGDAGQLAALVAGAVGPLDVPALSGYQAGAIKLEEELSCAEAFKTGMGDEAYAYLQNNASGRYIIDLDAGRHEHMEVYVRAGDGAATVASIDVVARANAVLDLDIMLDSLAEGTGLVGSVLRVFAGPHARVNINSIQTADDGYIAMDDTGLFLDEDARVDVHHTVLGAGASYTGLAGDLRGDRSCVTVTTSYLGAREQLRDFNYELRHRGRDTVSDMQANGVLAGASRKTLRGTIDLVHGCKGSQGNEREVVLLADERVRNKTVPVILCDEDDVAGNHGATIGHVRPEQLFYLGCRGLSQEEAEALFLRAKLEEAALATQDERARAGVVRLGTRLFPDFEEELS